MENQHSLSSLHPRPPSSNTVTVRMIDTTAVMKLRAEAFLDPVMPGHELMSVVDVAFLIENPRLKRKTMFDLGVRKDYWNMPPAVAQRIENVIPGIRVDKDVTEILTEKGVGLEEIDDVIWSHSHWDHTGSTCAFPSSTKLNYGKGTGPIPGYPTNPDSALNDEDLQGRECIGVDYEMQIGPFPAHDFYGDESLYLLNTPGHWPGHICALARTTPDTFVLLGGDICHFAGDFRPSGGRPLPDTIPEGAFGRDFGKAKREARYPMPCPCAFFTDHHPQKSNPGVSQSDLKPRETPFYNLSTHEHSSYKDPPLASDTLQKMREYFDADPNILVCLAHDPALLDHLPTFNDDPSKDINDWKTTGMKEKCHWGFLKELPRYNDDGSVAGEGMRDEHIVEGTWREGKRLK